MLASIKNVLITLVIITVIAITATYFYSINRTFLNEEDEIGNLAGNIYNGGLFCEQDGRIYFSNDNDNGSLYVMNSNCTNIKKVHHDKAVYINVDENYIYYLRANNTRENNDSPYMMFNNTGMYRINQNGSNLKLISSNPGSYLTLKGNILYYQNYDVDTGLFLYQNQTDGEAESLLFHDAVIPALITDDKLYYAGYTKDHNINYLNLLNLNTNLLVEGNFAYPIFSENYIYYLDLDNNYSLNRMDRDGSNRTVLVVERCSTYNITKTGKYLYYQIDDLENSRICRLNMETMETETLLDGYYKQIHVTDQYVFFKDFDNIYTYILSADGEGQLGTFDPPNLNKD